MSETVAKYQKIIDEAAGDPIEAVAKNYLSLRHLDHPETGCLLAALGSELARQPASVRDAVTEGQQKFLTLLARIVPGRTKAARKKAAIAALATMIGGIILARTVSDSELRQTILEAVAASIPRAVQNQKSV
jgi:TetR/AcrR family transcriptional repressor of nem operon